MKTTKKYLSVRVPVAGEKGFSLIEVIVALAVLTIGVLAVNAMQTAAIRGNKSANDLTKATNWSADELERIWELDYDDPALKDENVIGVAGLNDTANPDEVVANDPSGDYTIVFNVAEDYPIVNIKTIYAIVSWANGTKSVTIRHQKSKFL